MANQRLQEFNPSIAEIDFSERSNTKLLQQQFDPPTSTATIRSMQQFSATIRSLQKFDIHIEEVVFTAYCSAWNQKKFSQIHDGLLCIVKREVEPRVQIIFTPAWSVDTYSEFCRLYWEENFDEIGHLDEVEPGFWLASEKKDFVVFFNNVEDSARALNYIRLVDIAPIGSIQEQIKEISEYEERLPMHEEEHRGFVFARGTDLPSIDIPGPSRVGSTEEHDERFRPMHEEEQINVLLARERVPSGTLINPSTRINTGATHDEEQGVVQGTVLDQYVYHQNTRVIMAMIAVLIATIVLTVGLNPPSIDKLGVKITIQITFWIAALFSLTALFLLGFVTPTTYEMQARTFRFAFAAIALALLSVVVAFGTTTVCMTTNLVSMIVGGFIGSIGIIIFSYFTSRLVRETLSSKPRNFI